MQCKEDEITENHREYIVFVVSLCGVTQRIADHVL